MNGLPITPEEDAELDALNALSSELSAALQSPWEPRCIVRAFATPRPNTIALTMHQWIDLEAIRSPLLLGEVPSSEELAAAADVFNLDVADLTPSEAADLSRAMLRACRTAFAAALAMRTRDEEETTRAADGFGAWSPIFTCLVTQCGVAPDAALAMRVDRAHILMATHRRNQGWVVAGAPYALRDLEGEA